MWKSSGGSLGRRDEREQQEAVALGPGVQDMRAGVARVLVEREWQRYALLGLVQILACHHEPQALSRGETRREGPDLDVDGDRHTGNQRFLAGVEMDRPLGRRRRQIERAVAR